MNWLVFLRFLRNVLFVFLVSFLFSANIYAESAASPETNLTSKGKTPKEFFASLSVKDDHGEARPRFVLLVGIPGSGKSTWARAAQAFGWKIINVDDIRERIYFERGGSKKEKKPSLIFSINEEAVNRAKDEFRRALNAKNSIVLDAKNTTILRVEYLIQARAQGYYTEALVFETDNILINNDNIVLRAKNGGLDLVDSNSTVDRMKILSKIKKQMDSITIQERPKQYFNINLPMAEPRSEFSKEQLLLNDFVNNKDTVKVRNWLKHQIARVP